MKKTVIFFFVSIIALYVFNSCYYDAESQLYLVGSTSCDTTNVTYSITITSILNVNGCLGCHSGSAASGGNVILDNYNSLKTYALNGKLYGSINHSPGYIPMPQGGNKMSSCYIKKVQVWINAGFPNN